MTYMAVGDGVKSIAADVGEAIEKAVSMPAHALLEAEEMLKSQKDIMVKKCHERMAELREELAKLEALVKRHSA